MIRRLVPLALAVIALLAAPGRLADARPGGGHSFSGGGGHSYSGGGSRSSSGGGSRPSSSYSGGSHSTSYSGSHSTSSSNYSSGAGYAGAGAAAGYSSGGGGYSTGGGSPSFSDGETYDGSSGLMYWLFETPVFWAIFLVIAAIILVNWKRSQQNRDWDSGPPVDFEEAVELTSLDTLDPNFSQIVFEDFIFRLFSAAQRARHSPDALAQLAPYVSEAARGQLAQRAPVGVPVQQVVVGAMRTFRSDVPARALGASAMPNRVTVYIELEANIATAKHTYYTVERWAFGRDADVHSKPPDRARTFPCPNCGAPWQAAQSGSQVCASCGQVVDNGRFDWVVETTGVMSSDERPPSLTTETVERGTDLPTYRDDNLDAIWQALVADDPTLTQAALQQRLSLIYTTLNAGWTSNELKPVRGLVSDGLFDYLQYWVDAYRSQNLRNVLDGMHITHSVIAKITRDRFFDAVTIRLFATGKDYTINTRTDEQVVGSRLKNRDYSEYWTLIRTSGRQGAPHVEPTCGNCGAPLSVGRAGECEHCGAHVTGGEFDWVLSKIEQDDTYRG
ncbi:MAG TPA: TIM44-like domain-containing protein [Kofleriaceae bacterium]